MNLIITLLIVTILSLIFTTNIKKHAYAYYAVAAIIAISTSIYEILRMTSNLKLGGFILTLEKVSIKGIIAISFFILVMYAGALIPKWKVARKLLTIRAELAILGSIFMLPHGIIYFARFIILKLPKILSEGTASALYLGYIAVGIIGFLLMIPLFITSIKKVRRKMNPVKWKKLQRWAYAFYFLAYLHIILILFNGKNLDWTRLSVYTLIFGLYTILRLFKYKKRKQPKLAIN
ncbi:ferric reductase-like transmembrane domain-containing protein [Clostridium sp. SHJSY1]|uniref:ferric reductase-like transmembrane domain-containing protein n=1 Tax=Clostridium sp. SHJSY1 TaxID=2942483 RepID=UPI002873FA18|nr:ferric reductase-like transmembrane domain-containing protein [Clostridium sp. SHJSY1]MDS0526454.1 ferric reductase-like transmembrane domain-containing protein [Clostridium sp. SHJSY1]